MKVTGASGSVKMNREAECDQMQATGARKFQLHLAELCAGSVRAKGFAQIEHHEAQCESAS
jgi:hypothetical protein